MLQKWLKLNFVILLNLKYYVLHTNLKYKNFAHVLQWYYLLQGNNGFFFFLDSTDKWNHLVLVFL